MSASNTIAALREALEAAIAKSLASGHSESETFAAVQKALKQLPPSTLADLSHALTADDRDPYAGQPVAKAIRDALVRGNARSESISKSAKSEIGLPLNTRQQGAGTWTPDFKEMAKVAAEKGHIQKFHKSADDRQSQLEQNMRKLRGDIRRENGIG